jgi:hypothetical protein
MRLSLFILGILISSALNRRAKCPSTGYRVQGFVAQEDEPADPGEFVPVNCPVCAQVHLVDPKTRKVLGADESEASGAA